ncbi:DUF4347 domain-containing protein [Azospirillum picis]|uniref:DUF4347 domain-containing protein n=1 Tax=Azospirillum picis TaxID=488438 RepID=A0ABU0MRG8_9PROT|nr:DUF4347 domain-containing protein [Azospirillum picis]MBP2300815.1 hypothetical protein [Azospirillum picis]MDQ0536072.1 hypothetical protein [Azospirillum picis]
MFDGAAAVTAAHTVADAAAHADSGSPAAPAAADPLAAALANFAALPATPGPTEVRAVDPAQNNGRKEVVFVDTATPNYRQIAEGVKAGIEVEVIDASRDGLAQIAQWAETHKGYDAIHVVAHGAEASLRLGSAEVTEGTLATEAGRAEAAIIGSALTENGDLMIYGCGVAKGTDGQRFVTSLAAATGADVAASDSRVGSARLGGSWALDVDAGSIETAGALTDAAMAAYDHVLAPAHDAPDADVLAAAIDGVSTPQELRAADPSLSGGTRDVAFIDTAVADYQSLVDGMRPGTEIRLIDSDQSGFAQIAVWAQTHSGYDSIHILSHGSEGRLFLGTDMINDSGLSSPFLQAEMAAIGTSLNAGGDLLLYGCDIAKGAGGIRFLQDLSAATGADVAASADQTGDRGLGGNWTLEEAVGRIDPSSASLFAEAPAYRDLLATAPLNGVTTFNFTSTVGLAGGNGTSVVTATNVLNSGWDISATFTANTSTTNLLRGSNNAGIGQAPSYSGTFQAGAATVDKVSSVTFTANDGSAFDAKEIYIASTEAAVTATITGYRNGSAVTGAVATVFLPRVLYTSHSFTLANMDGNDAFNNVDKFVISFDTAQSRFYFDNLKIGPANTSASNSAPVLSDTSPVLTAQSQSDTANPSGAVGTLVSQLVNGTGIANYTDADSNAPGMALTATNASGGTWYYTTDGGSTWTAVGSVSTGSALLLKADASTRLYLKSNGTYSGTLNDAVTFRAWDGTAGTVGSRADTSTNGGSTAFSSATDTASLTVNTVNHAPVLDATKSPALTPESKTDQAIPTGAVGTLVSQIIGTTGIANYADSDGNAAGIALTGTDTATAPGGSWYYTTDGGANWYSVGTVSDSSALLLKADAGTRLYFVNNGTYTGTMASALTFRAWDQTSGTAGSRLSAAGNGGNTAFSATSDTASLVINATNTAPTFTSATTTLTVDAGSSNNSYAPLVTVSDTDSGQVESWTVLTGPSHGTLALSSGAATAASGGTSIAAASGLTYTPGTGYAGTDSFTIQVSDGTSTISKTITVTVTPGAPSTPDLVAASDAGSSSTDDRTNATVLKFSGTGAAYGTGATDGSDVIVFISSSSTLTGNGAAALGSNPHTTIGANLSGVWDGSSGTGIDVSGLGNGTYYVYAYTRSLIGGVTGNLSAALAVTIDRTAPTLAGSSPALDATAVATGSSIQATFSEAVQKGTGTLVLYNVTTGSTVETFDVANSGRITGWGTTTLTVAPTSALAGGNVYSLRVDSTAVTDTAGNAYAGISNDTVIKFTTANTAPTFSDPGTATLTVNKNSATAVDLASYLQVSDTDPNQTLTWTVITPPSNSGTLTISGATHASGGTALSPGGTITYKPAPGFSGTETFTIQVSDGISTATRSVTVTVNAPPTATAAVGSTSYTEQGAATAVDTAFTVTDAEGKWTNGSVSVSITAGAHGADTLAIATSNGGGIWYDTGTNELKNNTTVIGTGTAASTTGSTVLTFTLNANATTADVQALARAVTFANASTDPSPGNRTVTFTIADAGGATSSAVATRTVAFALKNDAPTLTATAATTPTFSEGSATGVALFTAATASTVEGGQTFSRLVLTVSGLADGANETLAIDGSDVALTNGNTVTTGGSASVAVSVAGTTATVTITKSGLSAGDLQTLITALAYKNTAGTVTAGNRTVTLTSVQDSGGTGNGGSDTATVSLASTIGVTAPNHAPTVSGLTATSPTFTEKGNAVALFSGASLTSGTGDSGQSIKAVTLTVGTLADGASEILVVDGTSVALTNGNSVTTGTNGYSVGVSITAGVATVTITKTGDYSVTAAAALINGLAYKNTSNNPADGASRTVTLVSVQDNGGTGGSGNDTLTLSGGNAATVTLSAVNDAPILTVPSTMSVIDSNIYVAIGGVSATDADVGGNTVSATLSANAGGNIKLTTMTGITVASGANDSSSMTISGTLADVNAALASLTFKTGLGSNGDETITVTVDDGGHSGSGGNQSSGAKLITVTLTQNDIPVVTVPPAQTFTTAGAHAIAGISVGDSINDGQSAIMSATVSATKGTLQLTTSTGLTFTFGTNDGSSGALTFTGTLDDINAALATLHYTYSGAGSDTDTITVAFSDTYHSGADNKTGSNSIAITLTANSAGTITVPGSRSVTTSGAQAITGISVADGDAGTMVTATIAASKGTLAVTGATSGSGNGNGSVTITGTLAQVNTALATLTYTYTGSSASTDTDTITVDFSDGGNTANLIGGTKSATQKTIAIGITANTAPSFTSAVTTLSATDGVPLTVDGSMAVADADLGSGIAKVTVSAGHGTLTMGSTNLVLVGGAPGSGSLSYAGTLSDIQAALRTLAYTADQYYHGTDTIAVTLDDQQTALVGGNKTATATIAVTVTHTDLAPVVTVPGAKTVDYTEAVSLGAVSVTDADVGSIVMTATVSDISGKLKIDAAGSGVTITGGANDDSSLTFTGTLSQINAALASLTYQATNLGAGGSDTVTITVNDGNTTYAGGAKTHTQTIAVTGGGGYGSPSLLGPSNWTVNTTTQHSVSEAGSAVSLGADGYASTVSVTVSTNHGGKLAIDTTGVTVAGGANDTSSITVTGTKAQVNAALASLKYTSVASAAGSETITVAATYTNALTGLSTTGTKAIAVTLGENDAPTVTAPSSAPSYADTLQHAVGSFQITDPTAGGTVSATVNALHGILTLTASGSATILANDTGTVTVSGSLADVNATLGSLKYATTATASGTDTITVTVNDGGTGYIAGAKTGSNSLTITLTQNDTPVLSVPAGTPSFSDTNSNTVSDGYPAGDSSNHVISIADAGAATYSVTVSNLHGNLSFTQQGAASLTGNGTTQVVIGGSLADVNATLATLRYQTTVAATGVETINVSVSDGDTTAIGGAKTAQGSFQVALVGNDTPVVTSPTESIVVGDNRVRTVSGFSFTDTRSGATVTATVSSAFGLLHLTAATGATVSNNDTGTVTISGSTSAVNATLASFTYQSATSIVADTIQLSVNDGNGTAIGGAKTGLGQVAVVTAPNDAPVMEAPSSPTYYHTAGNPLPAFTFTDSYAGDQYTATITVGSGSVHLAAAGGATIAANDAATVIVSGSFADVTATLAAMTYTTTRTTSGTDTLTVSIDDGNVLGFGGNQVTTRSVTLNLIENDTPTLSSGGSRTFDHHSGNPVPGFAITDGLNDGSVTATVGALHGNLSVSAAGGATVSANGSGAVTITGSRAAVNATLETLAYATSLTASGTDTITLTVRDNSPARIGGEKGASTSVAITLIGNDTPVLSRPADRTFDRQSGNPVPGFAITDGLNDGSVTATVGALHGSLSVSAAGGATVSANGSGAVTITGSRAAVNATLETLAYTTSLTASGTDTITLTVRDDSPGRVGGEKGASESMAITLIGNDTPVLSRPADQSFSTAGGNAIPGFAITDGLNDGSVTATVRSQHGSLSVSAAGGATVSANGSGAVTITGSQAAVNATLASLTYATSLTASGTDTITLSVDDGAASRVGGAKAATVSMTVVLTADDAASLSVGGSVTATTGIPTPVSGIVLADRTGTEMATITLSAGHGILSIGGRSGATITLTGSIADLNALLAGLRYTTTLGTGGTDAIAITLQVGRADGVGGIKTTRGSIAVAGNTPDLVTPPAVVQTAPPPITGVGTVGGVLVLGGGVTGWLPATSGGMNLTGSSVSVGGVDTGAHTSDGMRSISFGGPSGGMPGAASTGANGAGNQVLTVSNMGGASGAVGGTEMTASPAGNQVLTISNIGGSSTLGMGMGPGADGRGGDSGFGGFQALSATDGSGRPQGAGTGNTPRGNREAPDSSRQEKPGNDRDPDGRDPSDRNPGDRDPDGQTPPAAGQGSEPQAAAPAESAQQPAAGDGTGGADGAAPADRGDQSFLPEQGKHDFMQQLAFATGKFERGRADIEREFLDFAAIPHKAA